MNIAEFQGHVIGFLHAHPDDRILHAALTTALPPDIEIHEQTLAFYADQSGAKLRLGELSLARTTARWIDKNAISLLITPPADAHPDHAAATHVGRLAAGLADTTFQGVTLLQQRPPTKAAWPPQDSASGARSAASPFIADDFLRVGRQPHQPSSHRPLYQIIRPTQLRNSNPSNTLY